MVEIAFSDFGFNTTESAVLSLLLQNGAFRASQIASSLGIKRPTIYLALESLMKVGLISRRPHRSGAIFSSIPKTHISKILTRIAKDRFEHTKHAISTIEQQLDRIEEREKVTFNTFEISSIESSQSVYFQLGELLNSGDFAAIFNPQMIPKAQMEGVVDEFLRNSERTNHTIRELVVPGVSTNWYKRRIRNKKHEVRELPKHMSIHSDIILVNETVTILNYVHKKEFGIRIQEENFYRSFLNIFNGLWESEGIITCE